MPYFFLVIEIRSINMQRLARLPIDEKNQKSIELLNDFKTIKAILARYVPPSTLTLFAEPRVVNNMVEWYSTLQGQAQKVIDNKEKQRFDETINQRLTSIETLVKSLSANGQINSQQAQQIEQLVQSAKMTGAELYEINGDPVIVAWGTETEEPKTIVSPPVIVKKRNICYWLLPLFFLLFILGLLWWFLWRQPEEAVTVVSPKVPIIRPLVVELPKPKEIKVEEPPKVEELKKEEPKKEEIKAEKPKEIAKPKTAVTAIREGQEWVGRFKCGSEWATFRLKFKKMSPNGNFEAVEYFAYDNSSWKKGAVMMVGKFNKNNFKSRETTWVIVPPRGTAGWYHSSYEGKYNPKTDRIEGRVSNEIGCSTFTLKKAKK